jgi:hypothetical protein
MAFYGQKFLTPDQAGPDSALSPEHLETASEIGLEWLTNALDSTKAQDAGNAQLELEALAADGTDLQGIGAVGSRVIAALDHIPWLSKAGLVGAARLPHRTRHPRLRDRRSMPSPRQQHSRRHRPQPRRGRRL